MTAPSEAASASERNVAVTLPPDGQEVPKITVRFRPVGSTKRLRAPVVNVPANHQFASLVAFLQRQLALRSEQPLFCYINSSFAPAPDAALTDLHACYAVENVLTVSYCGTVAFG